MRRYAELLGGAEFDRCSIPTQEKQLSGIRWNVVACRVAVIVCVAELRTMEQVVTQLQQESFTLTFADESPGAKSGRAHETHSKIQQCRDPECHRRKRSERIDTGHVQHGHRPGNTSAYHVEANDVRCFVRYG